MFHPKGGDMDETRPLIDEGGATFVDMISVTTHERRGSERVEAQKELSPSQVALGLATGDEEVRSYFAQKVATVNMAIEGIFFVGSIVVIAVEGATGSLDLQAAGWAVSVVVLYTSGAGGYYAKQTRDLIGLSYQIDRLRGQVTRLSEEVDRLSPEVDRLSGENDRYTQLLAQHSIMQEEMTSILTGLTTKHAELVEDAADIDDAVEGLGMLKAQFDRILPKIDGLVDGLRGQVSELTGQVDELTEQVEGLEAQVKALDDQVGELTEQIDGLEKTRLGLQQSVTLLSQLQGEADKQGAFDEKVNEESRKIVEDQRVLQEKRTKLQGQQEELIRREANLVEQLEEQAAKLSKLDALERLVAESAKRKVALANRLGEAEAERNAAKRLARMEGAKVRELQAQVISVREDKGAARRVDQAGRSQLRVANSVQEVSAI